MLPLFPNLRQKREFEVTDLELGKKKEYIRILSDLNSLVP